MLDCALLAIDEFFVQMPSSLSGILDDKFRQMRG